MIRHFLAAAIAAGSLATPALAQDDPPPNAERPAFSGPRIEALAGYDEGLVYGLGAGYDFRAGGIVLGLDLEATDSTAKECATGLSLPGDELCARSGRDLFAGGRIGVVVGSKALIYAKAGYSNQRIAFRYDDGTAGGLANFNVHQSLDGGRVAGGIELGLGRHAFIKGEYRYSNYEAGVSKHEGLAGIGFRF
jgi:outer membrane immunogenic protein